MLILGIMTGTSLDGLDAVCVEWTGSGLAPDWRVLWQGGFAYPASLRRKVLEVQLPGKKLPLRELLALDGELGAWYGKSACSLIARHAGSGREAVRPDVIANHGQTVAHHPDIGSTLQLGDPTRIATATGLTVVSHFREGDMAARGQGAPLLPRFHEILARKLAPRSPIAIHNLGGISNLTYIPSAQANPTSDHGKILAFDTGPSNVWIDEATLLATRGKKKFDSRGKMARAGTVDLKAVKRILATSYFKKPPPKSTGRDDFPFSMLRRATRARGENLVATATEVTVESIARAYKSFILGKGLPLEAIYFAGGGAKNEFLMERLASRLAPVHALRLSEASPSIDAQALEPIGFALFGYLSLLGHPVGGAWTGAKGFGSPGWITPGRNWPSVCAQLGSNG